MTTPKITIGFPHDPVKSAKAKEQTLVNLLSSRARAWDGYFDGLALAYIDAYDKHEKGLNAVKQGIQNKVDLVRNVVIGIFLPSLIGGGMSALVADKGKAITDALLPVATKNQAKLASFATGGAATLTEDSVKQAVSSALSKVVPQPGSEWDVVADSPLKFFIKLRKMVNDYVTDVTRSVESAKHSNNLDTYRSTLNTHLLSPFIQHAPMDTSVLHNPKDLEPIFEIFLWIVWARQQNTKNWVTTIGRATDPDGRGFVGKVWDGITHDDDALDRVKAYDAVKELDPILTRLLACGINSSEITQGAGWDRNRRILNILWVRIIGEKHRGTLLGDLASNLDAKRPDSFNEKPVTKFRQLK